VNRRRLYRSSHDRVLAGVAGGVAEYFDVDPSLVRILWVLSIFAGGITILLYIAMAIVVPMEPEFAPPAGPWQPGSEAWGSAAGASGDQPAGADASGAVPATDAPSMPYHYSRRRGPGNGTWFIGMILILFGAIALADELLPAWADHGRFLWPAFILAVGVLFVVTSIRRRQQEQ
jgi:phage shock protein C